MDTYTLYGENWELTKGDSFTAEVKKKKIEELFVCAHKKNATNSENIIVSDFCRLDAQGNYSVYQIEGASYYNFSVQTNKNSDSLAVLYIDKELFMHKSNNWKGIQYNLGDQIKRRQSENKVIAATSVVIDTVISLLIKSNTEGKKLYFKKK